ncbi:MAG: alcohol dehydrogenase catalytic domain-containing protein [bacterium]|jgi:L-iditol 2-dehydrogenase
MKAAVIRQIGSFEIENLPPPSPAPGEVRVKVAFAGLCRTDLKLIEVGHRDLVLPRIPAEEVSGTVDALGDGTDLDWLGKRVYVYPGTSCGSCGPCRSGAGNLCEHMQIMGFHRDGGFAEYVTTPAASLIELASDLDFESAVFAEPLSCCLNALELAHLTAGEQLGVWGAGPAGTLLARAGAAMGATPIVIEPDPRRRLLAGGVQDLPPGMALDVAIPAVGTPEAYHDAWLRLGPRGRLVIFSGLSRTSSCQSVDFNTLHYREQTLVGAYGCSYRHGVAALKLIRSGKVKVADLISHRIPLSRLAEGLDLVRRRTGMKILIYP